LKVGEVEEVEEVDKVGKYLSPRVGVSRGR
jgi:hypothetical protein